MGCRLVGEERANHEPPACASDIPPQSMDDGGECKNDKNPEEQRAVGSYLEYKYAV